MSNPIKSGQYVFTKLAEDGIVKSKWRKVYLILVIIFTIYTLYVTREKLTTISSIKEFCNIFIVHFYLLRILPISFLYFSLKWCWNRHRFLSWEEAVKIVIYSLIFLITFFDIYCNIFKNLQL
jgi:hypothetical protein